MLENPLHVGDRAIGTTGCSSGSVEAAGAILYTAEVAFGERHFEVTRGRAIRGIYSCGRRARSGTRENALNLLMQRLPAEAKYIAWIDADVSSVVRIGRRKRCSFCSTTMCCRCSVMRRMWGQIMSR